MNTKYVIEALSITGRLVRYLKAERVGRIVTTRHECNARKFKTREEALEFIANNQAYYGWTFNVKPLTIAS